MEWKEKYPKNTRPSYEEMLDFLPEQVREMFVRFNAVMGSDYKVYNKYQRYEKSSGWVYGYCRNYRCELLSVSISEDGFTVQGIKVYDENSLNTALEAAKREYNKGYEEKYEAVSASKKANQIARAKTRTTREKEQLTKLTESVDSNKLNQFKWCRKVSRNKLIKLYQTDAHGVIDEELLDDVGFTFYARCKQAKDIRPLMVNGKLVCHHCESIVSPSSYTDVVYCSCGYCYTYREYRRSFNANNIPAGRATSIFDAFADKWTLCRTASEKMILIDGLIHECHVSVMSGLKGRSVCVNLIEGTLGQLRDMLEMLAK